MGRVAGRLAEGVRRGADNRGLIPYSAHIVHILWSRVGGRPTDCSEIQWVKDWKKESPHPLFTAPHVVSRPRARGLLGRCPAGHTRKRRRGPSSRWPTTRRDRSQARTAAVRAIRSRVRAGIRYGLRPNADQISRALRSLAEIWEVLSLLERDGSSACSSASSSTTAMPARSRWSCSRLGRSC